MIRGSLLHNKQLEHPWTILISPLLISTPDLFQEPTSTASRAHLQITLNISTCKFYCLWVSGDFPVILVIGVWEGHRALTCTVWDASLPSITLALSNSIPESLWWGLSFCYLMARVRYLESNEPSVYQIYLPCPSEFNIYQHQFLNY